MYGHVIVACPDVVDRSDRFSAKNVDLDG